MFERAEANLPYGSTALLHVSPHDYMGQDIVPVLIARKAPSPWDASYSSDKMFVRGDVMVWIHDLEQTPEREGRNFKVPKDLARSDKYRAVPLRYVATVGMPMSTYMRADKDTSDGVPTWTVKRNAIVDARVAKTMQATNPTAAFRLCSKPLLSRDEELAPVLQPLFPIGSAFKHGFKGGKVFKHGQYVSEWSGKKEFVAVVESVETNRASRRHSYTLRWNRTPAEQGSARVPVVVDEGYLERYDRIELSSW